MLSKRLDAVNEKFKALKQKGLKGPPDINLKITGFNDESGVIVYIIQVANYQKKWECKRRFREFKAFHECLKKEHKVQNLPSMPKKSVFAAKAQQRVEKLNELLTHVVKTSLMKLAVVHDFLDIPEAIRSELIELWTTLESPVFEGWLEKLSGKNNWKRRYVHCCADYTIKHYDSEKLLEKGGVVDLRDIASLREQKDDPNKKFVIELRTRDKVWKFACRDQVDLDNWFNAMQILREDKAGLKQWMPEEVKSRSYTILDAEDDESKGDFEAIQRLVKERGKTEREIENIKSNIENQASKQDERRSKFEKSKRELGDLKTLLKNRKDELNDINKLKPKLEKESRERDQELEERMSQLLVHLQEIQNQNKEFERDLERNNLDIVGGDSEEWTGSGLGGMINDSPIVEGTLSKFRKGGRKRPKRKHVTFVALNHGCFVEWTDSLKPNQATTRMKLLGWSVDNKSMESRSLRDEELNRLFILHGKERLAIFVAESKKERDRWIDGFQRARLVQVAMKTKESEL